MAEFVRGREVSTGASHPEEDPVTYMTFFDWLDSWEYPEGREDLLPRTPKHILKKIFGVESYEEVFRG